MKKIIIIALSVVMALSALFSFSFTNPVYAKENTDVDLNVRNRTGGVVLLKLVHNGYNRWYTYEPGLTTTSLPNGVYVYYASTVCGNRSGVFNLNVTKELFFDCNQGVVILLQKPSNNCTKMVWVGGEYQWFEPDPSLWSMLLGDPAFEAELKCYDGVSPIAPQGEPNGKPITPE